MRCLRTSTTNLTGHSGLAYNRGHPQNRVLLHCTRERGFSENHFLLVRANSIQRQDQLWPTHYPDSKTVRITMAFRAFVRSPSRASQFLLTASDTEPASPMQKYSRRRCADSIGFARVAGRRLLHAVADSHDGLTIPDQTGAKGR